MSKLDIGICGSGVWVSNTLDPNSGIIQAWIKNINKQSEVSGFTSGNKKNQILKNPIFEQKK